MAEKFEPTIEQTRNQYLKLKYQTNPPVETAAVLAAAEQYISTLERESHRSAVALAEHQITKFPRIRNLSPDEQREFSKWLMGQTCPFLKGVPYEEQDGYYPCDYDAWKAYLKGEPVSWD
jgi:hypothetical protein